MIMLVHTIESNVGNTNIQVLNEIYTPMMMTEKDGHILCIPSNLPRKRVCLNKIRQILFYIIGLYSTLSDFIRTYIKWTLEALAYIKWTPEALAFTFMSIVRLNKVKVRSNFGPKIIPLRSRNVR